ncbi:MAG: hypothetical protein HY713_12090 [candidate division NC10 bacterium]|nr:hypothetical protein [candidate division NC10 bacterium]
MRRFWAHLQVCLLMAGMLLTACAAGRIRDGAYLNEAKGFAVRLPSEAWEVEMGKEPDLQLRHRGRRAGIVVNATCGEIPPGRPLEIASRHLFFGIHGKDILRQELRMNGSREAVEVVLRGSLEGQELLLHGFSVKGTGCVYDLVLFAPPQQYAEADQEFGAMVRHFQLLGAEKP